MPRVYLRGMDADEFLRFREFSNADTSLSGRRMKAYI